MIQHVTIEVRPADLGAVAAFLGLLGFEATPAPEGLRERADWVRRGDQQVHLLHVDEPDVPRAAHFAIVAGEGYAALLDRLRAAGHEVEDRPEYWGSPRAYVRSPAGHLVEVMASPPA